MTDTDVDRPVTAPGEGPEILSPRDEARIVFARHACLLSRDALALMPTASKTSPGDFLSGALELRRKLDHLIEAAVIAERECGSTWEQIAQAAQMTRQSAHEKWAPRVQAWATLGRQARSAGSTEHSMDTARWLDGQYERVWANEPEAVTAGLDATRHPGSDAYEAAQRKRGTHLHARLVELREQARTLDGQYHELKDAKDEDGLLRLAGVLTSTAANHDAQAAAYDQLVTAEPSLSDEHRGAAERQRGNAYDARQYALLTTRRTA
ncbi:hypothetical protein AR457_35840 [Streptomyces agglomeratus]|uniref:Uncharacterized protein n=1 Tax=Streptomyces agglomeratus TaxID=285458 RepID=A0A1E5NY93_9ACTN|nr:hypothetical protein [Streptomyces agglomeratus]OEJ21237.1 hypothetical protein AS594_37030 [Streptomyces agglomeratus]OEJ22675.1 hypothetical protein AR457_35840 [Streptomyces agglomeratus]OEJ36624.1 hypothetical protein BGK72_36220 [Streptomyces agglomeratus]OEJ56343.1 hypothetical protein BGM19_37105 [Streptomyces agglomeratus]